MKSTIIAAAAIGFAAIAHAAESNSDPTIAKAKGQAKIVSYCSEDVYLQNTPSGSTWAERVTLNSDNPEYIQNYSQIEDNCGWSIKFGPYYDLSSVMQYEYTWQGEGQNVWYDMSFVNSNGDEIYSWEFVSSDDTTCNPNMANYFTESETTTGMQTDCDSTIDLTLYICGTSSGAASSSSSSASAASSTASEEAATTSSVASSTQQTTFATSTSAAAETTSASGDSWTVQDNNVESATTTSAAAAATTTAASTTTATAANGNVVTEVEVAYVTEISTHTAYVEGRDAQPTPAAHRRHVHGHPHGARN